MLPINYPIKSNISIVKLMNEDLAAITNLKKLYPPHAFADHPNS